MTIPDTAVEGTDLPEAAAEAAPDPFALLGGDEDETELAAPAKEAVEATETDEEAAEAKLVEEENKPTSKLSQARAALAKEEAATRAEAVKVRAEAEALKKDRADLEAAKSSGEAMRKLARTDLAKFVADLKLDPETAKELVKAAWWSLQDEDKRPKEFKAAAKTRTELDEIREKAEKADRDLAEYKKSVEAKEAARENQAKIAEFFGTTRTEFAKLELPITNAVAKKRPAELDAEVQKAFLALVDAGEDEEQITPDKLGAAVEAALSERYGVVRDVFAPKTQDTQAPQAKKAPPTTALSTKKVAGGGTQTKAPQTSRERFEAALKELGD